MSARAPQAGEAPSRRVSHGPGLFPPPSVPRIRWRDVAVCLWLALLVVGSRAAYRPAVIYSPEGARFAFALDEYDPAQEHPPLPGYPLYIGLARLIFERVSQGDAGEALLGANLVLSALGCIALYWWGRLMFGRACGAIAATLFALDASFWHAGLMWAPYPAEALWAGLLGIACYTNLTTGRRGWLLGALALGIGGGFRPQLLICAGPIWLWTLRRVRLWQALAGVALAVALTAAWASVVVLMSPGGRPALVAAAAVQWREVICPGSLPHALTLGGSGLARDLCDRVGTWLRLLLGGSALAALAWLIPGAYAVSRLARNAASHRDPRVQLIALWVLLPALYHILLRPRGQGAVVSYLPALYILGALGLVLLARNLWCRRLEADGAPGAKVRRGVLATCGLLALIAAGAQVTPFVTRVGPGAMAQSHAMRELIEYIGARYGADQAVIVQSDRRGYLEVVRYYLPQYPSVALEQTFGSPRPSGWLRSPLLLGEKVETAVFLNPDARVAGESNEVRLAPGLAVRVKRIRRYQHFMHFSAAGVAFWASPHLPSVVEPMRPPSVMPPEEPALPLTWE